VAVVFLHTVLTFSFQYTPGRIAHQSRHQVIDEGGDGTGSRQGGDKGRSDPAWSISLQLSATLTIWLIIARKQEVVNEMF
jgi:hypothetical protein